MWIKNATISGFNAKTSLNFAQLPAFSATTDLQAESHGFSPVQGDTHFSHGKHTLLHFTLEKKHIPASAVQLRMEEIIADMETPPGKKARKELKERVTDEFLPRALPVRRTTKVWLDAEKGRIITDSTSDSLVNLIQTELTKAFPDLGLQDAAWPSQKVLTEWLIDEPAGFTLDDEVSLAYPGEHGKTVKFTAADLADDDVQHHVQKHGASIQAVAMTYDSRVSFIMTDAMQLRRIRPTDLIQAVEKDVDQFTNDFVLMTAELSALISAIQETK